MRQTRTDSTASGRLFKVPPVPNEAMGKRRRTQRRVSSGHLRDVADVKQTYSNKIEWVAVSALHRSPHNARTHSMRQLKQISRSIKEFGFTNPILIDEKNEILAGHGRWAAAQLLGWREVPTLQLSHLTKTQKRAYIIADNQLAAKAGWDLEILRIELQGLDELDFDLELTGFDTGEVDFFLADDRQSGANAETIPAVDASAQVCRAGDVWQLGDHVLLCGDATVGQHYDKLLNGEKARFVFTDPPYNVRIAGNVSGLGAIKHREFRMASGEMSSEQFVAFLKTTFLLLVRHMLDGAIGAVCMDWRHLSEMMEAGAGVFTELKNVCVWVKANAGMGSFYRSRHELVFIWKKGHRPHVNNFELGQHGRSRSNVWEYAGANSFGDNRTSELSMHPTCKPVDLIADAILDCSKRRDIVLDCFGGSGSTLIACEKTGRAARLIEIDPLYCDVTIRRWQKFGGGTAIHQASGRPFLKIEQDQNASMAPQEKNDGGKTRRKKERRNRI
jgi:DNA modification methylase